MTTSKNTLKTGTVALVVALKEGQPVLLEQLSDDLEITLLEEALQERMKEPLELIYAHRQRQQEEDEEFGDYVERLLSQPAVRPEIQAHGVQWLKSKLKIESFQKSETEASKIIADFAFRLFREDPDKTDFILAGPVAQVRVRVFQVSAEAIAHAA